MQDGVQYIRREVIINCLPYLLHFLTEVGRGGLKDPAHRFEGLKEGVGGGGGLIEIKTY